MPPLSSLLPLVALLASLHSVEAGLQTPSIYRNQTSASASSLFSIYGDRPDNCPPCFNCNLQDFKCHQFANCTAASGRCSCPEGWGGEDCTIPLCGSLADGKHRAPREGDQCECTEGWEGINCNVCSSNHACDAMMPGHAGGVCHKEGLVVHQNFQNCDVTNPKIVEALKDRKPEVTFSCKAEKKECNFQCKSAAISHYLAALTSACSLDRSKRILLLRSRQLQVRFHS